ncbi:MAG: MFS transporter [Thermomicrobium sp.]|nr:MFS transporter [Thermomicrobium sp.]MDW8059297.1 MFS transporter [Thermomicrobium sp.]
MTSRLPEERSPTTRGDCEPERETRPLHVLAASWLAYATFYFPRLAFAASKLGLLADPALVVSRGFLGFADALFLAVYATGQFVSGALAERLGPRRLVILGLVVAAAGALLLAAAAGPTWLIAALVVQGAAQSTGWSAVCSDVARATPPERRGTAFGVLSTSYAFGALAAPVLLGWFAYALAGSWRAAPLASAAIALAVAAVYAFWLAGWRRPSPHALVERTAGDLRTVLRLPSVWLLSLADFLLKPVIYATVFWAPVLVRDALPGLSPAMATTLAGSLGLAGFVGPLLAGLVSDRWFGSRRAFPTILALLGCALTLALYPVAAATGAWWGLAIDLLLLGVTLYAAESLIVGVAAAESGRQQAALAVGIVNGIGSAGGILGGLVPGLVRGESLFFLLALATLAAVFPLLPVVRGERHPVAASLRARDRG